MNSLNRLYIAGSSRWSRFSARPARLTGSTLALFVMSVFLVSCGGSDGGPQPTPRGPESTAAAKISAPEPTDTPVPGPTKTPAPEPPRFTGYDLDFSEGDFWRFRWEYTDRSCAQGSGCKTTDDEGIFQVTLGDPKTWEGITVYRVIAVGKLGYEDGPTSRQFVPEWDYLGVDGHRIVATDATGTSPLTTLFDAQTGLWAGSGFFAARFPDDVLVDASPGQLTDSHEFASWEGVKTGPWHFVRAAASQGKCETIEGRRICPREESFDYTETEYYRPGIGPFAYAYNYTASFSGGGFTTTFSTVERVVLIASSLMGDDAGDFGKPTPTPVPTPTSTPVVLGDPIFGPTDGSLELAQDVVEIPEFPAGVNIGAGVADTIFENPNATGNKWSHGISFRQSGDEAFHAVFITGDGDWGHFARGGSLASQVVLATGRFDFDTEAGGRNRLTVWFGVLDGKSEGVFLINGQKVADLDLSFTGASGPGDISVLSGLFPSDEFAGGTTQFTDFTVYEKP